MLYLMKIVLGNTDNSGDKKLSLFICTYVLASSFNIAIKTIFNIPQSAWSSVSLIFEGIIVLSLIGALPTLLFRKGKQLIIAEGIFVLLYAFSILLGEADANLLKNTAFWTLAVCIPIGVAGIAVNEKQYLFQYLKVASYIEYPVLCLALFSMKSAGTYNMSVSYVMILPVLFLFYDYFENRRLFTLLLAIFGSFLIIIYGARGPAVCVAFYVFIKLFFSKNKSTNLRILILRFVVIAFIVMALVNWDSILRFVEQYLNANGINSYSLKRLINGQIMETAGRNQLWDYYFNLLNQKPLLGYGLLGGWIGSGEGPHNMLLEFLLAFGYILGGIIVIGSIILLIKAIRQRDLYFAEGLLILCAYNFTMYLVSGDWLEKPLFFLFAFMTIFSQRTQLAGDNSNLEEV